MFYFFVCGLVFFVFPLCLEVFCYKFKVAFEHADCFVAKPSYVKDVDFVVTNKGL